ncbi:MAG: CCA tRNA nucleotidyltransferase [Flavobacteriales bacterium Tduv]
MDLSQVIRQKIFQIISLSAQEIEQDCYVIGGYVRDFLLGKTLSKDIDIVTTGEGILLAKQVAKNIFPSPKVSLFKRFGTAMLKYEGQEIEFVGSRKESYRSNSRKPIVETGTLEDDQNRRDFTINTLAISLNQEDYGRLIDPFNGQEDLKRKIIRTPLDPEVTYSDDPLRMFRAIRFATQLRFTIETASLQCIRNNKQRIHIVSMERIMDEFQKIFLAQKPSIGLQLLYKTELLTIILPELTVLQGIEEKEGQTHKDNFYHTLEVVDNISRETDSIWLRWAALLHDIGKSPTKKYLPKTGWTFHSHEFVGAKMIPYIFRRLKLPMGSSMKYVQKIVRYSSRPIALVGDEATDSAVRRLLFDAGDDLEDLMTLCKADITTKNPIKQRRYKKNFSLVIEKIKELEEKDRIRNWQPPISGTDIMDAFGLGPCKQIGIIKSSLKEAILEGEIPNEYDSAFAFMLKKGKELGLQKKKNQIFL